MSALLNGGVANASDGSISVANGTLAPAYYQNGLPFEADGKLAVDFLGTVDHHHQGLGFTANGRIVAKTGTPVDYWGSGAAPFLPVDVLNIVDISPDHYSSGVGYGPNNAVCISTE